MNPAITTAEDANRSATAGGPTHGFFYRSTDFLLDAAKEYAALGEDEVFYHRNIADVNFCEGHPRLFHRWELLPE